MVIVSYSGTIRIVWSSYLQYIGRRKPLDFVTYAPTLALVSGKRPAQRFKCFQNKQR
jgi:hypothetical protein